MGVLHARVQSGLSKLKNGQTAECWTIEQAKPSRRAGEWIEVSTQHRAIRIKDSATPRSFDWFCDGAMIIDELSYAKTTYDNIVRQNLFRQLYQVSARNIAYVEGTNLVYRMEECFPCQDCGLVLPLSRASIDHIRPQSGGQHESVAKVLRVLGLTVSGPTGTKTQELAKGVSAAANHQQGVGAGMVQLQMYRNMAPVPTRPGRGPKAPSSHQEKVDRYSLTWEGALFYSVLRSLGMIGDLETRCMHSLVNLRPVCSSCNSSRGNQMVF